MKLTEPMLMKLEVLVEMNVAAAEDDLRHAEDALAAIRALLREVRERKEVEDA